MTRSGLLLGILTLALLACGKYGPPVRNPAASTTTATPSETPSDHEEEQKNPL